MNICIIAHFAYGAITGGCKGHAGGVERQTSILARWLAARGHQVSLLTWDEGQKKEEVIDGVRIIKMCRQNSGFRGLRFFHPRWTSLISGMRKANAELYYQNCAEYVTGQAALWCKKNNRFFIFSSASNTDCDPNLPELRTLREKILFRYGLKNSSKVIVQTKMQEKMIREGWGLPSTILPMPCPGPTINEFIPAKSPTRGNPRIVWVGRISKVKRLEYLLDIAEMLPEIQFDVAGKPDVNDPYSQAVIRRAKSLTNITLHGRVAQKRMARLYKNASLLCCTSIYEGFPNTFLEAWSHGLPIISTYDPDFIIATLKLGAIADEPVSMTQEIKNILQQKSGLWQKMSENSRTYYLERYTVDSVMALYEECFSRTITNKNT